MSAKFGTVIEEEEKKIPELRVLKKKKKRNQVTNGPSGCSLSPLSAEHAIIAM